MNMALPRRRASWRAKAGLPRRSAPWRAKAGATMLVLLQAASALAHHSFAAEYDVEAIGASHGG
jgi:hypothetical protein